MRDMVCEKGSRSNFRLILVIIILLLVELIAGFWSKCQSEGKSGSEITSKVTIVSKRSPT